MSVGFWKEDQTVEVELERTRLPESSMEADETPREVVLESHTVRPLPLTRRREPVVRNWREAEESTGAVVGVQMGTPPE